MQGQVECEEISLETAKLGEGRDRWHRWELWLQEVTFRPEVGKEEEGPGRGHGRCKGPEASQGVRGEGEEAVEEKAGHTGPRRPWASLLSGAGKEPFGVFQHHGPTVDLVDSGRQTSEEGQLLAAH